MLNDLSIPLSAAPFNAYPASTRVIIIHPNFDQARRLLSRLMQTGCYLRLQGRRLDRSQLEAQLAGALALQAMPIQSVSLLIVDEADRADGGALIAFIRQRLALLPRQARIIILSRELPTPLLRDGALSAVTALYPMDDEGLTPAHISLPASLGGIPHTLEVRAFGAGRVLLDDRLITQWDGALPRALFFFLVDRGLVTRGEIFALFWPALSVAAATNVFHVTKRKMTEVLGVELTHYSSGFYHLSPSIRLVYDVSTFLDVIGQAEGCPPERALILLQRALSLYRSGYLTSLQAEWSEVRREQLKTLYVEALVTLGRLHQARGETRSALGMFVRAIRQELVREDLVLEVMNLYSELGETDQALHTYARLCAELECTTRTQPAPTIQALADSLRAVR